MGLTSGKYLIKSFLTSKLKSQYLKYRFGQISINSEHFSFWDQLGPRYWEIFDKKDIFDIKIENDILKISNVPNLNKF